MKLKKLGLAAVSALALMAIAQGTASGTTLEVNGVPENQSVSIPGSLTTTSLQMNRTDGAVANTCATGQMNVTTTSPFTGTKVTGTTGAVQFAWCNSPITVDKAGQLYVEHISGSTNGTVFWENAEVTVGTPFGGTNCRIGEGIDIGTFTGVASGHATIDINTVLNCGFLAPSMKWSGAFEVTSPTGLGVSS